jgi:hypothetical protein
MPRHAMREGRQFNILIDKPYHYSGHKFKSTVMNELAEHFKGHSTDLMVQLDHWVLIESAKLYGLVEVDLPPGGIDNLRDLISRCRWLEENAPVIDSTK